MKQFVISTLFVIGSTCTSNGQNNSYGISVGTGSGMILNEALTGAPSYDLRTSISIGLQYSRKLTNRLHFMTGINWYKNKITVTPAPYPGMDITPENHDIQLLYIPLFLKVNASKYFFINGGIIADVDITKNKYITAQSGVGTGFGIGVEFPIKDQFSIQLNPYLNFHGLLLANSENYPERVLDAGIKLSFALNK